MKFIFNMLLVGAGVVLLCQASFCVSLGGEGAGDPVTAREGETKTDKILQVVSLISEKFTELKQEVALISHKLNELTKLSQDKCSELNQEDDSHLDQDDCIKWQLHINGTIRITLWGNTTALCDTNTDEGGWIIIQRRINGDVDFFRGWNEYKTGFGNLDTSFWLGNDAIHRLTEESYNELRIDMIYDGRRVYAHYSNFSVASEAMNYQLTVGAFEGTVGDSLTYHNNMYFSTFDRDNDPTNHTCADYCKGAWWYNNCYLSNLNGQWGVESGRGVTWAHLTGYYKSVSFSEMKVRRG